MKLNILPLIVKHLLARTSAALKQCAQYIQQGGKAAWRYCHFKSSQVKSQFKQDRHRRQLRKRPWYLMLGAPQSGKSTLLAHAGFNFIKPEHAGEEAINYVKQLPDCDWWFAEEAVFIDLQSHQQEQDGNNWRNFIKLIKRNRKSKPLNGIILTISLSDILLSSNNKRQAFAQETCRHIREIHTTFKARVPVYIVFTKCDLIEGFMEFFNDLSKEELNQVWGVTFPLGISTDPTQVSNFFINEYAQIITRLRKRVLWALDSERSPYGRERIHAFPQQMQLLKKPLATLISELFAATRYHNALQLRGLYFTSSIQQGKPHDFLLQAMSKKFQLVPPNIQRPVRMGECYFLHRLFSEVILPEAPHLGHSENSKRLRDWGYRAVKITSPLLLVIATTGMYQGYKSNEENLQQLNQYIARYKIAAEQLKPSDSLTALLPLLNSLNSANHLYKYHPKQSLHLLYESATISKSIDNTLQRALHSLYLPRIAGQLEAHLNENIQNPNLLYATLKGYLAFSASDYTHSTAILAPMEYSWDKKYLNQQQTANQLKFYLHYALKQPLEKLPLNHELINRRRDELQAIVPADRAYGLLTLRASVGDLPAINLASATGGRFKRVFKLHDEHVTIPALYTQRGLNSLFLNQYARIAHEVANDNRDIGLSNRGDQTQTSEHIQTVMQKHYTNNYVQQWDAALNNIDIVKFNNMAQAIKVLNIVISKNSPLSRLLAITYDNTYPTHHAQINTHQPFNNLNSFTLSSGHLLHWNQAVTTLKQLRDYLIKLNKSANHDLAYFNAAKAAMKGKSNPIQALTVEASTAPAPVKKWLQQIANHCWHIIIQGAHREINAHWHSTVINTYRDHLRGRYPFVAGASSEIAIADFTQFFGKNGALTSFFNQYLKPFTNTNNKYWHAYHVNGHSIEIPASHIALFQHATKTYQQYFNSNAGQPRLSFSIKPSTLSNEATSIQFRVGNHTINYRHGPRNTTAVTWPMPLNAQQSQLMITDFKGTHHTRLYSGAWSFFKLLQAGHLQPTNSTGRYLFTVNLDGYNASFVIYATANIHTLRLSELIGFKLPNDIATPDTNKPKEQDHA